VSDGRLHVRLHPGAYDVIISEPSNPWLAGTSDLFTADFYRLAVRALRDDGLFCQWAPVYGLSPDSYRLMVRTFLSVFPHTYLVTAQARTDTLLLGSRTPFVPDLARANERLAWPGILRDLADPEIGVTSIYDLAARFRAGPDAVRNLAGTGLLHTDDLPRLAYQAPRELYLDTRDANEALIRDHGRGLCPALSEAPEFGRGPVPDFFAKLAAAYRAAWPIGREARACLERDSDRSGAISGQ
jgi:spermidine synthase